MYKKWWDLAIFVKFYNHQNQFWLNQVYMSVIAGLCALDQAREILKHGFMLFFSYC